MKRVSSYAFVLLLIMMISCNKDDDSEIENQPTVPDNSYIPLQQGNYWIYEHYKIDTAGNETLMDVYDSLFISGSTIIQSNTYFIFEGTWMSGTEVTDTVYQLRDSLGYFVDPAGWIHFSTDNFTDILATLTYEINGDTLYESWYKMETDPAQVSVGAGTFATVNYKGTILTHNPSPGVEDYRYKDRLYSENVGQVLDTYFYLGSPIRFERRLKTYYVDENSNNQ